GSAWSRRTGLVGEPETVSVDRLDQAGSAKLLPQRRHVHVEYFSRAVPVLVLGTLEHLLAADHPARVTGQALQDGELLGGNGDLVSVHADLVRAQVYGKRAVLQHLGLAGGLLAAAEHGPDPGQQLLQPERLDQVVVGTRSRASTRSVSSPLAVTMMMAASQAWRRRRQTSTPSMSGRPRSSRKTSGTGQSSAALPVVTLPVS